MNQLMFLQLPRIGNAARSPLLTSTGKSRKCLKQSFSRLANREEQGSSVFWCEHPGICGPSYWARAVFPGIRTYPRKIQEQTRGAFFEGRFKSVAILDEQSLLATCAYIDLNPVAAGIAEVPEASAHASIKQRVAQVKEQG